MRQWPSLADAREGEVKSGLALRVGLVQCAKSVRPYGNRIDDMPASPPSSNHLTTPARRCNQSLSHPPPTCMTHYPAHITRRGYTLVEIHPNPTIRAGVLHACV